MTSRCLNTELAKGTIRYQVPAAGEHLNLYHKRQNQSNLEGDEMKEVNKTTLTRRVAPTVHIREQHLVLLMVRNPYTFDNSERRTSSKDFNYECAKNRKGTFRKPVQTASSPT